MKRIFPYIAMIVIYSLLLMGCGAEKTLRTAKEQSAKMSIYGANIVQANIDAYRAGEITQAQLADLNSVTSKFATGLGVYRDALAAAELAIKNGADKTTTLDKLYAVFDDHVVAAFFAILDKFKVLPVGQSEVIKAIISSIRIAIRAIQGAFDDARHLIEKQEVRYATA